MSKIHHLSLQLNIIEKAFKNNFWYAPVFSTDFFEEIITVIVLV